MMVRLVLVAAVVVLAWSAVAMWERRRPGLRNRSGLLPGVTLVTGPGCRLCDAAEAALRRHQVTSRRVTVDRFPDLGVRAVPTVLVADRRGRLVLRRSGRAAITDAEAVARAARRLVG